MSIIIGISIVWLTLYAIIELQINPFEDTNVITIEGTGIDHDVDLTLTELKSDKYQQIKDKIYY